MSRALRGLYKRFTVSGEYTWYIDKCIKRVGRLCESTGTADRDEAERHFFHRIRELRDIAIYGVRARRTFHEAAATRDQISRLSRATVKSRSPVGF